jgi:DNA-binding transcriptional ArsR family regulator
MDPLAVLAAPRRRQILGLIWDRERSAGDIARRLPVTFGAVSQHLRVLREAGMVEMRRGGRQRIYQARKDGLGPLRAYFEHHWAGRLADLKALAEAEEEGDA